MTFIREFKTFKGNDASRKAEFFYIYNRITFGEKRAWLFSFIAGLYKLIFSSIKICRMKHSIVGT